jgi:hypothetical protein
MSPARKKTKPTGIFQLKVTLSEVEPAIWRRLLVPSNITLGTLHHALQAAMGWMDSHLHQFMFRDRTFSDPSVAEGEFEFEDERKIRLDAVVGIGQSLVYEYDFGDSWEHELLVEESLEPDERLQYPLCVAGARACPPEDVGGVGGYENFVQAIKDPDREDHDQMVAWVGGLFDPEGFDVNAANRALREGR